MIRVFVKNSTSLKADAKGLDRQNFLDKRAGFWADVIAVNSRNNSVDVIADIGIVYRNIPVMSREWVNADSSKNYVTAERYLPPKGARVFVLTPTHTIEGAFVLCSGYTRGETDVHTLYAKNESEKDAKNTEKETVTQGGWKETEDYANGNINLVSNDGNIKIAVNTAANTQKSQQKEVAITAWNNEVHITENGIEIKMSNKDVNIKANKVTIEATKMTVKNSAMTMLEVG